MTQDNNNRPALPGGTPLAIIGIGCLFPRAEDSSTYWANIREGIDAISDVPATHWRVEDYHRQDPKSPDMTYGRRGGFLSEVPFNPLEYNIPPATLEAIDSSQLLGLVVAGQALKDAGYGADRTYDRDRVSVILGVTGTLELVIPLGARLGHPHWREALKDAGVDETTAEDVVQRISDSYVSWQENSFPGLLGNVVAGRISKQYDLGGTNCVVDAACASSLSALHLASMELATGKSDMVITGGIDTFNDIFMYMCFSKTPALSPGGDAKPFDASGDGTILGEGLGIMVIKRLADAERDGDRIYAVIRGVGSSSDGKGEAIYTPSASGQKKAILDAYRRAGVTPDSIGLLEAHGTGTKVGDAVEVSALRDIYGTAGRPWCAIGSVKSQIGHTKAAAGAAGLIKAALALHHKVIPPTIKVKQPLSEVSDGQSPFYITSHKRPWLSRNGRPRRAAVSALGFGGSNFHVVLEEYEPVATMADWDGSVQILPLSASDAPALEKAVADVAECQTWTDIRSMAATLRSSFNAANACRLALVVEQGKSSLQSLCSNALIMLRKHPATHWSTPDGAWFACNAEPGRLGVLFPGQGAQYIGMLRDLACSFPRMLHCLEAADLEFGATAGSSLSDLIYPPTPFSDDAREAREAALRATDAAQPAIGAVSLGALRLLESFGLAPDAVAGHSYGELTALCAAGRLDERSFHTLSRLRGELMAAGDGDRGSMLAVSAPLPDVQLLISEEKLDLVIANRNAPNQAVLSGRTDEIARAADACGQRKLSCKRLPVAAAFHSALVADAAAPLLAALSGITISEGQIPVYSNSSAACYPSDALEAGKLLAGQLARPVEFVAEIEAMYASGIRTFVEVGPGARLSGLVSAILADRPHTVVALDASGGKRSGIADLARCLAQLAVLGFEVSLAGWDEGYRAVSPANGKKPLMTVNLCGANYVKPKPKRPATPPRPAMPTAAGLAASPPAAAMTAPTAAVSKDLLAESLRVTREGMAALLRMQDDTAQLHRRFLEGQEAAGKTIQMLLEQQQRIFQGASPAPTPAVFKAEPAGQSSPVSPASQTSQTAAAHPDRITEALLAVVSEKTGYPVEMLELEMGLDSDLGIDSIKRVEILSALQERLPGAPVIGPEHLGTLHTLGEIARFLGAVAHAMTPADVFQTGQTTRQTGPTPDRITETLLAVVSEKTGYPVEMLELEMGLDSDLGIDSIKRVEILSALQERLPGSPVIGPEHLGTLHTLGEIARHLGSGAAPDVFTSDRSDSSDKIAETEPVVIRENRADSASTVNRSTIVPIPLIEKSCALKLTDRGVIWITDDGSGFSTELCSLLSFSGRSVRKVSIEEAFLNASGTDLAGLVICAPATGADATFFENAFLLLKSSAPALRRAGENGGALFATISRLDGSFGCGSNNSLTDPLSGGLAGLVKTAAREWSEVSCKAIDLGLFSDSTAEARAVADELFLSGPMEVGLTPAGRTTLQVIDLPELAVSATAPLHEGDVVVITGGGRGVTTAAAVALAEAYRPLLVLLGRSPELRTEPEWLSSLHDESRIKRAILEHAAEKLHPREIEERYRAVVAGRELRTTIARVAQAGGQAIYRSVDIRDTVAVSALLSDIRRSYGPIRGIVHGAGVLADRLISDKTIEQFSLVYGTKVGGLQALLDATASDDLRIIALFASTSGRFGRSGQVDYSVANEVLNKLAQAESRRRSSCRTVSINWGPWDGGMVTPALKKVFAGEGIGLISLNAGGELLVREIAAFGDPVEIIALAGASAGALAVASPAPAKPLAEAFTLTLTVEDYPFIRSHVIDGKAVLPMAMIVEWLAHGALHGNPGFRFHGFNNLRICKGVIFDQATACTLRVMAGRAGKHDSLYIVPVELTGSTSDGSSILHVRAEIVLATKLPEGIRSIVDLPTAPYIPNSGTIYDHERLFHGPDLQGIEQVGGCSGRGITALVKAAPHPGEWIRHPLRNIWLTDPLVIDSAFQLMILWSFERSGSGSLPSFAGCYRQFQDCFPRDGAQIVIRVTSERDHGATADIEFLDRNSGKLIARLEDYECVIAPSLQRAFRHNQLSQPGCVELEAA
ncbi:MAG: SDR family NAD(P)-dependent oxidoreductase [Desulfuromonadales bacterium]